MSIISHIISFFKGDKEMSNVLFIVGSLRQGSFNHQLAQAAEKALEGKATVTYLDWSAVPVFSQDLEGATPAAVEAARQAVLAADAIWFFSPVYNFSIPGSVKNLIDWLSRALDLSDTSGPSALHGKVTTVSSVANAGFDQLFPAYQQLLSFVRTNPVGDFTSTTVNPEAWATGELAISDETIAALAAQADAVLAAI